MNSTSTLSMLATRDWGTHIPKIEELNAPQTTNPKLLSLEDDLSNLARITQVVKDALNLNGQEKDLKTIIHKCCEFATHLPSGIAVIKAFKICGEILKTAKPLDEDKKLIEPMVFVFDDGEKIEVPSYYKKVLACESDHFHGMFSESFKEVSITKIPLHEIKSEHFQILLKFIEGNTVNLFQDVPLDQLFEIGRWAQFFFIKNFNFTDLLNQKFQNETKVVDKAGFQKAIELHTALNDIGVKVDKGFLRSTLATYYGEYLQANIDNPGALAEAVELLNSAKVESIKIPKTVNDSQVVKIPLKNIKTLNALDLSHSKLTNVGLAHFVGLPLTSINLSNCMHITNDGLNIIKKMPLQTLILSGCTFLNEVGLGHVAEIRTLTSLNLSRCEMTNPRLALLKELRLRILNLAYCVKLNNEGIVHLKGMPLVSLNLKACNNITNHALANFKGMPLETLNLAECKAITAHGLDHLNGLPLLNLDVSNTKLDEAGVILFKSKNPKVANVEY